jgi:hypothetical protein
MQVSYPVSIHVSLDAGIGNLLFYVVYCDSSILLADKCRTQGYNLVMVVKEVVCLVTVECALHVSGNGHQRRMHALHTQIFDDHYQLEMTEIH